MLTKLAKPFFAFHYRYCAFWNILLPSITLDGRKIRVFPSIYKPLENEHRLVDWIEDGKTVLDMGCGSGVLTVFAALKSTHVTAVDINPEAVENTRLNCASHGLENVTATVSDMFNAVNDQYDYIISSPPFFRIPFAASQHQWATSNHFVDDLFTNARNHLRPGGHLVVLLPRAYRPSPERLARGNGLIMKSVSPHRKKSLSLLLRGLPYLHLGMNSHVYIFQAAGK